MSTEALAVSGETQTTPEEEIKTNLEAAYEAFKELPTEEGFEEVCEGRELRARDIGTPAYCEAMADYGATRADAARAQGRPERETALGELLAATPDYVYKQAQLNSGKLTGNDYEQAREDASYYNGLVRKAAVANPDLRVAQLHTNMLNAANDGLRDRAALHIASNELRNTIRGARAEIGLGQMLDAAGLEHREASLEEDLGGIDIVSEHPRSPGVLMIDAKVSLHDVQTAGRTTEPYFRNSNGKITMYCMAQDKDFNGGFFLPDDIVQERSVVVKQILQANPPTDKLRVA